MLTVGHLKNHKVDISYGSQVYIKDVPELVDISRELASPVPFCPWLKMRRARRNFEEKGAAVDRSGLLWMGTARVSSVGPEEWYRSDRNVKDQRPTFWRCLKPASVRRPVQTSCVRTMAWWGSDFIVFFTSGWCNWVPCWTGRRVGCKRLRSKTPGGFGWIGAVPSSFNSTAPQGCHVGNRRMKRVPSHFLETKTTVFALNVRNIDLICAAKQRKSNLYINMLLTQNILLIVKGL